MVSNDCLSNVVRPKQSTRRYFCVADLVIQYKAQLLSFIEYRTSAIYHASTTALERINRIQRQFLAEVGISEEDALLHFGLAPLQTRRDIAMLGFLHRAALRKGPVHFHGMFPFAEERRVPARFARHALQLKDIVGPKYLEITCRSAFGLVSTYNALPRELVDNAGTVPLFQKKLQDMVKDRASRRQSGWQSSLGPPARRRLW